jgi:hypothetical protein
MLENLLLLVCYELILFWVAWVRGGCWFFKVVVAMVENFELTREKGL